MTENELNLLEQISNKKERLNSVNFQLYILEQEKKNIEKDISGLKFKYRKYCPHEMTFDTYIRVSSNKEKPVKMCTFCGYYW